MFTKQFNEDVWEALVPEALGIVAVLVCVMVIISRGIPNSYATTCATFVLIPLKIIRSNIKCM